MRFASLKNGKLAIVVKDRVIPARELPGDWPEEMAGLLSAGETPALGLWKAAVELASSRPGIFPLLGDTDLAAPLPRPRRNIICVGKNYAEHVNEVRATALGGDALPDKPIFFTKATTAVVGPADEIPAHRDLTSCLDYEGEIAVIISTGGRAIKARQAWEHVFGITAINDVSARDLQTAHRQWFLGKSLDGAAPMGPTILHVSALPALEEIHLETRVNGEIRQRGNPAQLIFDIPKLISVLSRGMSLLPGDIIATGTPKGVGAGFDPPRFLQPGDLVEVELSGVGCLRNRVSSTPSER